MTGCSAPAFQQVAAVTAVLPGGFPFNDEPKVNSQGESVVATSG